MSDKGEALAERLVEIDARIEEIKRDVSDPELPWPLYEVEAALGVAQGERADIVARLEELGLEDPDL